MAFKPNRLDFDAGVKMLRDAATKAGLKPGAIVTSKDAAARKAMEYLAVTNVPDGFTKWMLPVFLNCPSQQYFSYAAPGVRVPKHSHDDGDGLRVILHGSITYNNVELGAGDWMFVPKGEAYDFQVGPRGAGMFYCYCCCCA
jgi:hypothetical protein